MAGFLFCLREAPMENHTERHETTNFYDDLDHASASIDGRRLSFGEAEDLQRADRLNVLCEIAHGILSILTRKDATARIKAIIALIGITSALCAYDQVRVIVEELIEAKEEDLGSGGPPVNYDRALCRHRELVQGAELFLRKSPQAPSPDALTLWVAARLQTDAPLETLEFVYLNAVRLYRLARERYDDPLDLPDCPNEALRSLLDEIQ